ncbi:metallophosphoesterase [Desulfovibrio subterraneus]|uniref:Calcineurin-like phosphoesterase domain-containing protein n=1 Tax=Desulfovibrio subterraneus TaxID=2718620 RepID=A0A7J0BMR3_9BACT|nr:metallophosphoesterase [Desulfovibrio subterraneus]GFM34482.1 hypothetical protein DSM101010T_28470 [Desulfovibrio subterraneus]
MRDDSELYDRLRDRMGENLLRRRLLTQVTHTGKIYVGARGGLHLENTESFAAFVRSVLSLSGMLGRTRLNALDIRLEYQRVVLETLPEPFDGFRVLQLSDIHLDGFEDGCTALKRVLHGVDFDACVITGDFRFFTLGSHDEVMRRLEMLMPLLDCPHGVTGILGNHDFIEFVPELEDMGVRVLLNESVLWERQESQLGVAGVDDPHFYMTDDLRQACKDIPDGVTTLLLAHSPELYAKAAEAGIAYYLCGHTHGGQLCLPGGIPLITNARCHRRFTRGRWQYGNMQGYTSRGTGSSGVAARLFCPPEITIHELRRRP